MYIIHGIGNNYIVKLNNKLLNLPHLKDLYFIEVFNFMFKFILLIKKYNKVQSNVYWVKYVKTFNVCITKRSLIFTFNFSVYK